MSRDRATLAPSVRGRTQERLAFSAERNPIREPLGLSGEFPLAPVLIAHTVNLDDERRHVFRRPRICEECTRLHAIRRHDVLAFTTLARAGSSVIQLKPTRRATIYKLH
jgi:hypothetical protein